MPEWLTELLFWIVIFVVFFYGFRWLQSRKARGGKSDPDDSAGGGDSD